MEVIFISYQPICGNTKHLRFIICGEKLKIFLIFSPHHYMQILRLKSGNSSRKN